MVDQVVDSHKTREVAEAYLKFLYTDEAQEIVARRHFRPSNAEVWQRHAETFPDVRLFPITAIAKNWDDAFERYFGEGGVYDSIYTEQKQ